MVTPPPGASKTSRSIDSPSSPTNFSVTVPLPGKTKSVARYWSPKAWRPTTIGRVQPGTRRGTFLQMIGWRKITPPRMLRMVPFGERHICFRPNSSTRASSGVMVAHFTPDAVSLDGVGGVDGDLVVGPVALLDAEVVVFQVDVEIGQDQLLLDEVPDDPGHLVAVELDDRVRDFDLGHFGQPLAAWHSVGIGARSLAHKPRRREGGRRPRSPGARRIRPAGSAREGRVAGTDHRKPGETGPQPVFVLVAPQMGENIGAAARAMWNFGLDAPAAGRARATAGRTRRPRRWPAAPGGCSTGRGSMATTAEACADLTHVFATTARDRALTKLVMTPERGDGRGAGDGRRRASGSGCCSGRSAPGSRPPTWCGRTPWSRCR